MRRWSWLGIRLLGGVGFLAVLVYRLGDGPFLNGLRALDARALVAALLIGLATTTGAAWRWRRVAHALGIPILGSIAACYRAQFVNSVLPVGVLGDVERAVRHGREVDDVGAAARAVVWERTSGQVVQIVATLVVLVVLPTPFRNVAFVALPLVTVAVAILLFVAFHPVREKQSRPARILRTVRADVRMLANRSMWPGVVVVSALVVVGHCLLFVVAVRTSGSAVSTLDVVPIAMLVLLASSIPANIGGWGAREGAAALSFSAVGLGAASGVSAATVYGVLVVVSTLPGAAVLIAHRRRLARPVEPRDDAGPTAGSDVALHNEVLHG